MNKRIGIFDSGLGGLTIFSQLLRVLPNEDYLFYEDSINNPYGEKSESELFDITSRVVEYLINNNCKIIVIACNTATTACMKKLKAKFHDTLFVGTVPAIKMAYDAKMKKTLLLATSYTMKSERVKELINDYTNDNQEIFIESGNNLANLIELGDTLKIRKLLNDILLPYRDIDSIILGCTHYPLVKEMIKEILPDVKILDGSLGVATEVKRLLAEKNLFSNSSSGNLEIINSKSDELVDRSFEILKNMVK